MRLCDKCGRRASERLSVGPCEFTDPFRGKVVVEVKSCPGSLHDEADRLVESAATIDLAWWTPERVKKFNLDKLTPDGVRYIQEQNKTRADSAALAGTAQSKGGEVGSRTGHAASQGHEAATPDRHARETAHGEPASSPTSARAWSNAVRTITLPLTHYEFSREWSRGEVSALCVAVAELLRDKRTPSMDERRNVATRLEAVPKLFRAPAPAASAMPDRFGFDDSGRFLLKDERGDWVKADEALSRMAAQDAEIARLTALLRGPHECDKTVALGEARDEIVRLKSQLASVEKERDRKAALYDAAAGLLDGVRAALPTDSNKHIVFAVQDLRARLSAAEQRWAESDEKFSKMRARIPEGVWREMLKDDTPASRESVDVSDVESLASKIRDAWLESEYETPAPARAGVEPRGIVMPDVIALIDTIGEQYAAIGAPRSFLYGGRNLVRMAVDAALDAVREANPDAAPRGVVDVEAVLDVLFTNGAGERADRLVLTQDNPKRDLGGWSRKSVEDVLRSLSIPVAGDAREGA